MTDESSWVVDELLVHSSLLGEPWRLLVQHPEHLRDGHGLPWIWLLHGRTGSIADMRPLLDAIAAATRAGDLAPAIVVAPDSPDDHRTSWWLDSDHVPLAGTESDVPAGRLLESSLLDEVLPELEGRYAGPAGPSARITGGISMGGGAALRWLLVRPDLFGSAVLLSPAVFADLPVAGSAGRRLDVIDVEASIFDTDAYERLLHYPTLLAAVRSDRAPAAHVVTVVGDEEPVRVAATGRNDLELEAARLHVMLKTHPGFRSSLRVVGGEHDWPVWERNIVPALQILAD